MYNHDMEHMSCSMSSVDIALHPRAAVQRQFDFWDTQHGTSRGP